MTNTYTVALCDTLGMEWEIKTPAPSHDAAAETAKATVLRGGREIDCFREVEIRGPDPEDPT